MQHCIFSFITHGINCLILRNYWEMTYIKDPLLVKQKIIMMQHRIFSFITHGDQLSDTTKLLRRKEGRKGFISRHTQHILFTVIWRRTYGKGPRTTQIVREETRCCHIGYSVWLTARVLLYASSHRQDSTYHSLCYTSRGALAGTRNSSMGPPHEGSILLRNYVY